MGRIVAVLVGSLIGFLVYGVAADSAAVAYYVPITLVLAGLIGWLHSSVRLSNPALWGLLAVAIGNVAGGVILVDGAPLYEAVLVWSLKYDKVFHALATGVGAWAALEALVRWGIGRRPALVFAAVMVAGGAGALVEIVEYFGSLLIENDSVGGYTNNMQDLIANMLGALAGALVAYRYVAPSAGSGP